MIVFGEFTVKIASGFKFRLRIVTFELIITDPELIVTSVLLSGTVPQLQFPGVSHAVLTEPVHVSVKRIHVAAGWTRVGYSFAGSLMRAIARAMFEYRACRRIKSLG